MLSATPMSPAGLIPILKAIHDSHHKTHYSRNPQVVLMRLLSNSIPRAKLFFQPIWADPEMITDATSRWTPRAIFTLQAQPHRRTFQHAVRFKRSALPAADQETTSFSQRSTPRVLEFSIRHTSAAMTMMPLPPSHSTVRATSILPEARDRHLLLAITSFRNRVRVAPILST